MPTLSTDREPSRSVQLAEWFNQGCACVSLNPEALTTTLERQLGPALAKTLARDMPGLFSPVALFLPAEEFRAMQQLIDTVESVVQLPAYQQQALQAAPMIARHTPAAQAVFMGYDFHRNGLQPKLIEINTNAGGAYLNAALQSAQQACCADMAALLRIPVTGDFGANVLAMFREEWSRERGDAPLQRIAIVDQQPAQQFLYPEFELARQLFVREGIEAIITAPEHLRFHSNRLWHADQPIDLVYNRLTDFFLEDAAHEALREAYIERAVVLTPHPHAYALFANKHNLVYLSDPACWRAWQLSEQQQSVLAKHIPKTIAVNPNHAEPLWQERRQWFFKPAQGFGSKASYRGDKLTRSTFAGIVAGDYVAQHIAPPTERIVNQHEHAISMKTDVRIYRYAGRTLLVAARLYQGQTTNMRTPGGGFAAVYLT
ncbi:hypothetical protein [Permianibacter aggregans]|uniref:Circularly permuted ATP-grasp superfamily protein n=1 Tax=Permianibacter aggregans TaxID=1510150 RepID=A0A4V3D6R4_9GAMM|nr:hypothetical protein [Permianibacter aggregans]QGX38147.1 hypothetical protein E2H98_00025 [Permianibacter aggregans]QGX38150.1 hypothetical protein E2H98_00065 [Permianibacter aggregans]TDQ45007.1 hypothetical protein EV696_12263 [Permianibacter aggregans]